MAMDSRLPLETAGLEAEDEGEGEVDEEEAVAEGVEVVDVVVEEAVEEAEGDGRHWCSDDWCIQ